MAFRVDRQGKITNDILHLLGVSEPKRLDAKLVFGKDYNHADHQVKVKKIDHKFSDSPCRIWCPASASTTLNLLFFLFLDTFCILLHA